MRRGSGTGRVSLEVVGVVARCCLNAVCLKQLQEEGEAAPRLAAALPEGPCGRSSSFVSD